MKINLSIADSKTTKHLIDLTYDFDDLIKLFTFFPENIKPKNAAKAFVGGHFFGAERRAENLKLSSVLVLDVDSYLSDLSSLELDIEKDLSTYSFIAYSTASHTETKPRIRIVLQLSNYVSKEEYTKISNKFIKSLTSLRSAIDLPASTSACHLFDLPNRTHEDYKPWYKVNKAKLLEVADFLDNSLKNEIQSEDIVKKESLKLTDKQVVKYLTVYDVKGLDYHGWLEVGEALHHQYKGSKKGLELWDSWSKDDHRYDSDTLKYKYSTFKTDKENLKTFATIIKKIKDIKVERVKDVTTCGLSSELVPASEWYHVKGQSLTPVGSSLNLDLFFKYYKIKVNFDVITKKDYVYFDGVLQEDYRSALITIKQHAVMNSLMPDSIPDHVYKMSIKNKINSFKSLIESIPQKGNLNELLEEFYATLIVNPEHEDIKKIYMKKWLIQLIHMTCLNESSVDKVARYVFVLKGEQGIGKTTWFNNLLPKSYRHFIRTGAMLNTDDAMSVFECIKHVIVELGELGSTFKRSANDRLKAFLTQTHDMLNRKYVADHVSYKRTTVFCGSVNNDTFLTDETGSTRFWVLPVEKANFNHNVDVLQLLRELYEQEKISESNSNSNYYSYVLNESEEAIRNTLNATFETVCPLFEIFNSTFDIDSSERILMNASEILEAMGFPVHSITKSKRNDIVKVLKNLNYVQNTKLRKYKIPPVKKII